MLLFSLETKKVNFVPLTSLFLCPLWIYVTHFASLGVLWMALIVYTYTTLSFSFQTLLLVQEQCHLKVMA